MLPKIILLIAIYVAICLFEIPRMIDKGYRRELIIFLGFLLPALALNILQVIGVKLPVIIPGIATAFKPLLSWMGFE